MVKNLRKSFLLLISTIAMLYLFLSTSLTSIILITAVFVAVMVVASLGLAKPPVVQIPFLQGVKVLLALLIAFMGYDTFKTTWLPSGKAAALANALHLTTPTLLLIVGLLGCVVGFYAMYTLSGWIVTWTKQLLKEKLPEQRKTEIIANVKRNWYFLISAMAFFCLYSVPAMEYLIGLLIVLAALLIISSQIPSIPAYIKQNHIALHIVSILTALGICWAGQAFFDANWSLSSKVQALENMLPISIDIPVIAGIFGAVVALFFVYFCVVVFWKKIVNIFSETRIFSGVKTTEWGLYGVLLIASLCLMVASFAQTEAFYGTEFAYDIIYTSDSPSLVKDNVYLALTHPENDLRQPLFAVFAAPFTGIPYVLGKLFGTSASVQAMLMNSVQIVMLFTANFMLTKMMKLNPVKRICFMLLNSCTYTQLLFTLMMEQYIVAYFWLIFCMYLISEKQQPDRIALWGASGTLLTGMILLPFTSNKSPFKNFKEWFADMVKYGLEFVAVMLVFCRFDVIFNLTTKVSYLSGFTVRNLTLMDKVCQYTAFIRNCFTAPDAGVNTTAVDHISWQLNTVTSINSIGVIILLLVIVSTILNRDKKSSLLAAGWVAFSVVMLLGLGWGTKENGLILYALYFGWAFLVLLFQLVERIENKLNVKFLVPLLSIGCAVALAAFNIPAIMKMVNFAITYFPV